MTRALLLALLLAVACGGAGAPPATDGPAARAPQHLWTCSMHPQVLQVHPGSCPICGMQLTPLSTRDTARDGDAIRIDPVVVQNMGIRTATVTTGTLRRTVRAVGTLEEAEPHRRDVNLRVSGWIEHLYAATEGMHLREGGPLFDLYSPELQVAVEELIAARRAGAATLAAAARRKLELLGVPAGERARLERLAQAPRTVAFTSPIAGHLVEKKVVTGSAVQAGQTVLRIVDHSVLWLDAQVYEQDLPLVHVTQGARATMIARPGETFAGEVVFIHPHVDMQTRSGLVRIAVRNPTLTLRPGMWATVTLESEAATAAVLAPRAAVIDTGVRQLVFLALPDGRFAPREVTMGLPGADGLVQILAGLVPGETVVTSGQFLLDTESRTREAIAKHLAGGLEHGH